MANESVNSDLDTGKILELAKQTLFRVKDRDDQSAKKAEIILKKKKLDVQDLNFLLNFTFENRHVTLQPKTIRSMLNEILEAIGSSSRKDGYMATVSRSDLEEIHTYIMSNRK